MPDQFRITGRPQAPSSQRRPAALGVAAREHSHSIAAPAIDPELAGLVQGLSSLNPALARWDEMEHQRDSKAVDREAAAAAQRVESPMGAIEGEPAPVPTTVPPAFDQRYREGFNKVLAERGALDVAASVSAGYETQKETEGFNVEQFIRSSRAGILGGVKDPAQVAIIGGHLAKVEADIRAKDQTRVLALHEQTRTTTAFRLAEGRFTAEMNAEQLAAEFHGWFVPQMASVQIDQGQAATMLLGRLKAISDAAGGKPEVFAALEAPGPDGVSALARNPKLQDAIQRERSQAKAMRDKAIHEATEDDRAKSLMLYDEDIRTRPETVTMDRLLADVGPHGLSAEKAADLYHRARVARGAAQAQAALLADAEGGKLGWYDPKDQNKALDALLGTQARQVWDLAMSKPDSVPAVVDQLIQRHTRTGATVPIDSLVRFMETSVTNLPNTAGPDPKFLATAAVFKAMKADHYQRGLYFKGNVEEVMDAYTRHVGAGTDPKMAYEAAYRSVDPAVKEANRKRANAPEMVEKVGKLVNKYVEGSTMWGWIGGNGRPANSGTLGTWAAGEVRRVLELNPDLSDGELHEHIERKAAQNWVLDTSTQLAVKVPPAMAGPRTQEALSAYTAELTKHLQAKGEFPAEGKLRYVPVNEDQGTYAVQVWAGSTSKTLANISLPELVNRHRAASTLTDPERATMRDLSNALKSGQPGPAVDQALIERARSAGYFSRGEQMELERRSKEQFQSRARRIPDLGLGRPSNDNTPLTSRGAVRIDHKMTAGIANELAFGPGSSRDDHMGLAASLTALREGVALQAYDDPATGQGKNVGAGYNLKANAGTLAADMRAAGVPADKVQDVVDGRVSLTPDQAKRLLMHVLPRYEEATRKVAEKTAPGLWGDMTPGQRAVMVDVSYQVGDAGKFTKAWAALKEGKTDVFREELRTFYKKNGAMVEDTRALDLRASMLMGPSSWNARVAAGSR